MSRKRPLSFVCLYAALSSSAWAAAHTGTVPAAHMELKDASGRTVCFSYYNPDPSSAPVAGGCPAGPLTEYLFDRLWNPIGERAVDVNGSPSSAGSHAGAAPAVHMQLKNENGAIVCFAKDTDPASAPVAGGCPDGRYREQLFDVEWNEVGESHVTIGDPTAAPGGVDRSGMTAVALPADKAEGAMSNADLISYVGGGTRGSISNGRFVSIEDGVWRQRLVPTRFGSDRVVADIDLPDSRSGRLVQVVTFAPGFDWGGTKVAGKVGFGLRSRVGSSGGRRVAEGWSVRFVWNDGGALELYVYGSNVGSGRYGKPFPLGVEAVPGTPIELAMEVVANSDVNTADGTVRAYVDGRMALEATGLLLQSAGGTPRVERLGYSGFYGGNDPGFAPDGTNFFEITDIAWGNGQFPR